MVNYVEKGPENKEEVIEIPWNYDAILSHIGQFGKYQIVCFLLYCVPIFFPGWLIMSYSFLGGVPDYRCYVEGCDDSSALIFQPDWLNNTVPLDEVNDGVFRPSRCKIYNTSWESIDQCRQGNSDELQTVSCHKWVYDQSLFVSTVVTEFDLTCDDAWKKTFISTLYMSGKLVGAFTFGSIADWIGRKYAFMILTTWCGAFTLAGAFVNSFEAYSALRFFTGMGEVGYFLVMFVWTVEAVGPKYRTICGLVLQSVFSLGSVVLGGVAYGVREWRTLQIIIAVPFFVFLFYYFMPESPRWLISKERYTDAKKIIQTAANVNKKTPPVHLMQVAPNDKQMTRTDSTGHLNDNFGTSQSAASLQNTEKIPPKKSAIILDVFTNAVLCKRTLVMMVIWIACVLGYYGLSMSTSNLSGDFYVNYLLSMGVEIPSYLAGIFVMDYFGRRPTLTTSLIIGGVACLATGLVPADPPALAITLSLIGKFTVSLAYAEVFSYTAELFPTAVRSAVMGTCNTFGKIGGILSPIIADTGENNFALPYIIFGIITLIAGVLSITLPETKGTRLPATLEDAEDLEKRTLAWTRFCNTKRKDTDPDE